MYEYISNSGWGGPRTDKAKFDLSTIVWPQSMIRCTLLANNHFLGPLKGPLVLPLVDLKTQGCVLKIWINCKQAYMPYELSDDSSNQPDSPFEYPLWPHLILKITCTALQMIRGTINCRWSFDLPLTPWDPESESRINSHTFLGQFVLVIFVVVELFAVPNFPPHLLGVKLS